MIDNLETSVGELLRQGLAATAERSALRPLHQLLAAGSQRMSAPMRVAIVGLIKAGKSTSMNALLGAEVVATGELEVTFNVTWFQYGDEPGLEVIYKDGTRTPFPMESIDRFTRRAADNLDELLSVDWIVAKYPNAILKQLNLIDTPGLASFFQKDADNTLRAVGIDKDAVRERFDALTQTQTAQADAVLFMFQKGINEEALNIVELFSGPLGGNVTPLTAIGVLTKIDSYWPAEPDPYTAAERITRRLQQSPPVNRVLYAVEPLSGFLALGAQRMTEAEFAVLQRLATLPEEQLEGMLRSFERFKTKDYPDPAVPAPAERTRVLNRLGPYGIFLACRYLRSGVQDPAAIKEELIAASGLAGLKKLIQNHFGNRAYLIKLDKLLREVAALGRALDPSLNADDRQIALGIFKAFEELAREQHRIREYGVLRDYYDGKFDHPNGQPEFSADEIDMLLQVTREKGTSLAAMLGEPESTDYPILLAKARKAIGLWRDKAGDPGCPPDVADAARIICRSYERIAFHLSEALRHLDKI